MKLIGICLFFFGMGVAEANSVRLINDSPFMLRAIVNANDGTFLGEFVINPQESATWTDDVDNFDDFDGGLQEPNQSQTPYTVLWYCMNGAEYAFDNLVEVGAWVFAQSCDGPRICDYGNTRNF